MEKKRLIALRPHHGLCLLFFEGKGYSEEFIENMKQVLDLLTGKDTRIRLIAGVDDICSACPHNVHGVCSEESRVLEMDRQVLSLCHLEPADRFLYLEFADRVRKGILLSGKQRLVCTGCQWEPLCLGSLSVPDSTPNTPSDIRE